MKLCRMKAFINMKSLSFLCLVTMSGAAYSQAATDQEMVLSALTSEARVSNLSKVNEIVEEARLLLNERSTDDAYKNQNVGAVVVFSSGKTPKEVEALVENLALEISRIESKIALGDQGEIYTMSAGPKQLLLPDGSVEQKIQMAVGSHRLNLLMMAQSAQDASMSKAALNPEILIYKIEVVGDVNNIQQLNQSVDIAATFLDTRNLIAPNYEVWKENIVQAKRNSPPSVIRRLEDGPPPGISPSQIINNRNFEEMKRLAENLNNQ